MSDQNFQFSKEGNERLWVKTPFPVCQNVWASFVFQVFPEFQTLPEYRRSRHNGKYLNRRPYIDEIADGQVLGYIHAYLPHVERTEGKQDVNGLIHVPESRTFYLEQIEADLSDNPRSRTALLNQLKLVHAETLGYLLYELIKVPERTEFKNVKTTKGLRDRLGVKFVEIGLLNGYYTDHGKPSIHAGEIREIPIGKLPLYMRGNNIDFLRSQTCLDFLRDLDSVLKEDRELTPMDLSQIHWDMSVKAR